MMDENIKTTLIAQVTRLDNRGQPHPVYRVEFEVGPQGPFALEFTKAEFTTENVRNAQNEFARTIKEITGS